MSQTCSVFFLLYSVCCFNEHRRYDPESVEMLNVARAHYKNAEEYQDRAPLNQADYLTSMLSLPLDLRMKLTEFLVREDMRSLARSCKLNLDSCRQYIHTLISAKFDYLLNHNDSKITIKHLLNIPFVDTIKFNPLLMPSYFGKLRIARTSSKYVGIDGKTGNGFLSFWLKRVDNKRREWIILTFVFNSSSIERIIFTDAQRTALINDMNIFKETFANDIAAIEFLNAVLLNGRTIGMRLQGEWELCTFCSKFQNVFRRPISPREYVCLAIAVAIVVWLTIYALFYLHYIT